MSSEEKTKFLLRDIVICTTEQQLQVLEIRNQKSIRQSMYMDHLIKTNEHLNWISCLADDKRQKVFVVLENGIKPVGVVSINAIDELHKKTDWAFYLDENERGGLGAALEFTMLNYVFEELNLKKLNCEVLETNPTVVRMHKKFGFCEEGFRRSNIEKDRSRVGVHFLGLTQEEWKNNKETVHSAIAKIIDRFSISFDLESPSDDESLLTLIQKARAKNNVNWMALLRLSMEHHPHIAKPIISEILRLDMEISQLTKKLVE